MISTGEDLPPGSSIRARLYAVEVERNGLNLPLITELQSQRGRLRHAMRAYLEWLRPRLDDFGTSLAKAPRADAGLYSRGRPATPGTRTPWLTSYSGVRPLAIRRRRWGDVENRTAAGWSGALSMFSVPVQTNRPRSRPTLMWPARSLVRFF